MSKYDTLDKHLFFGACSHGTLGPPRVKRPHGQRIPASPALPTEPSHQLTFQFKAVTWGSPGEASRDPAAHLIVGHNKPLFKPLSLGWFFIHQNITNTAPMAYYSFIVVFPLACVAYVHVGTWCQRVLWWQTAKGKVFEKVIPARTSADQSKISYNISVHSHRQCPWPKPLLCPSCLPAKPESPQAETLAHCIIDF